MGHRNDLSGAILFARRPRLVLPPSPVDKLIVSDALAGAMDPNYTDVAAAIKLAMASFPEGTGKRIVLLLGVPRYSFRPRTGQSACRSPRGRTPWPA